MAGSKRARQVARASYERKQARRAARAVQRRRRNAIVASVAGVVVVVLAVFLVWRAIGGSSSTAVAATSPTPTSTNAAATGSATPSASASAAALHCSQPTTAPSDAATFGSEPPLTATGTYTVTLQTNCGPITMTLNGEKAPHTVNSFVFLAKKGYFDGTSCHRVTTAKQDGISVLQCGDPTGTGNGGPGYSFGVENAPKDGVYPAGTVAMARTQDPNSNGSQFFIVYEDTTLPDPNGYTVFGHVTNGLDIVKAVGAAGPTSSSNPKPKQPVQIQHVDVSEAK